jgi:hypothetical protein
MPFRLFRPKEPQREEVLREASRLVIESWEALADNAVRIFKDDAIDPVVLRREYIFFQAYSHLIAYEPLVTKDERMLICSLVDEGLACSSVRAHSSMPMREIFIRGGIYDLTLSLPESTDLTRRRSYQLATRFLMLCAGADPGELHHYLEANPMATTLELELMGFAPPRGDIKLYVILPRFLISGLRADAEMASKLPLK